LFGGVELLEQAARELPVLPEITAALETLMKLQAAMPDLPLSFDLSDLHGYHYHNGVVLAAYFPGHPSAIARGGRYDGVGKDFGRARPATGFSMDLREVARLAATTDEAAAILAPYATANSALASRIAELRASGEVVVELLPGESGCEGPLCDRHLVESNGQWVIQSLDRI
jgi:ATP phosphoribosyltransferase regulatory subunit